MSYSGIMPPRRRSQYGNHLVRTFLFYGVPHNYLDLKFEFQRTKVVEKLVAYEPSGRLTERNYATVVTDPLRSQGGRVRCAR